MTPAEELENLRSKIAAMETTQEEFDTAELAFVFSLPPMLAKLLKHLLEKRLTSSDAAAKAMGVSSEPKTAVFRLRKVLQRYGVDIKSRRHLGYWIEADEKQRLVDALKRPAA